MQLNDLRRLAEQRGFQVVKEYCDEGQSGTKSSRPALDAMLADAKRGKFQTLLIWKLDRLGRSTTHLNGAPVGSYADEAADADNQVLVHESRGSPFLRSRKASPMPEQAFARSFFLQVLFSGFRPGT